MTINILNYLFRDTGSMDQHADTLVKLLKLCLYYNHAPSRIGEFPPHAKVSSEIISCLFLVSVNIYYS